jgi:hypothetical protein
MFAKPNFTLPRQNAKPRISRQLGGCQLLGIGSPVLVIPLTTISS